MLTLHLFRWFSHTWLSATMRNSTWGFAIAEVGHLLALTILGGAILILDLRLLGLGLRRQAVQRVAEELSPLVLASVILMLLSGVLLVAADPMKYYESSAFRLKICLLFFAGAIHFVLHRQSVKADPDYDLSIWTRAAAVLSLTLWLSVGVAGRAIGLI